MATSSQVMKRCPQKKCLQRCHCDNQVGFLQRKPPKIQTAGFNAATQRKTNIFRTWCVSWHANYAK